MLLTLAAALTDWLTGEAASAGVRGIRRLALGTVQERALLRVLVQAIDIAAEGTNSSSDQKESLRQVLLERQGEAVSGIINEPTRLYSSIRRWIAPLSDTIPDLKSSGYLEILGVDPDVLAEILTRGICDGIEQDAIAGGCLGPIAQRLRFDRLSYLTEQTRADVRAIRERFQPTQGHAMESEFTRISHALPSEPLHFTGRESSLEKLLTYLETSPTDVAHICVIHGMPGIGKTAFAKHAARALVCTYSDGAMWIDLHGHTPHMKPRRPLDVLEEMLLSAGVPPNAIPPDLGERQSRWRAHVRDRGMIVVFDNARDSAQVEALMPDSPSCLVLITSRRQLIGLQDSFPLALDVLSESAAELLLVQLVGAGMSTDRKAITDIVSACGGLPLAVRIVASRARYLQGQGLKEVAQGLKDAERRLDQFNTDGSVSIRSASSILPGAVEIAARRFCASRLESWKPYVNSSGLSAYRPIHRAI